MYDELRPLSQVILPRMGPVMWDKPHGYHLRQAVVPIQPLESSMGDSDGRYIVNPVLPRIPGSRVVIPYRPSGFGSNGETQAPSSTTGGDAWKKWLFILLAIGAGSMLFTAIAR